MEASKKKTILIADQFANTMSQLSQILSLMGFNVSICTTIDDFPPETAEIIPEILIIDTNFPGSAKILDAVRQLLLDGHDIPVIFIAESIDEDLLTKTRFLAPYAFLIKPVNEIELISNITVAILQREKKTELKESMQSQVLRREIFGNLTGESSAIRSVVSNAAMILNRNINVLITGESGTGKELLARAIHKGSARKGPFVAINCAAISMELSDSLLFGHRKGAFTGAISDHSGYFEQANEGTIFLDEIGDMKPDVQAKVLRVIEEKKIRRVGEKTERDVDIRIISATNRDLKEAIITSDFRSDLYYRLEEYHIHIPPLRERREDIPLLAEYFLNSLCIFYELEPMQISESAMKVLMQYQWPGNIRELKNVIQRSSIQNSGRIINKIEMPDDIKQNTEYIKKSPAAQSPDKGSETTLHEIESRAIKQALEQTNGNVARAAVLLNIGRATLYRKIEKLGIKLKDNTQ